MPDASGNFKGISVPAKGWERVFEEEPELDTEEPEFDIVWTPDPSLDGAHFTPESDCECPTRGWCACAASER